MNQQGRFYLPPLNIATQPSTYLFGCQTEASWETRFENPRFLAPQSFYAPIPSTVGPKFPSMSYTQISLYRWSQQSRVEILNQACIPYTAEPSSIETNLNSEPPNSAKQGRTTDQTGRGWGHWRYTRGERDRFSFPSYTIQLLSGSPSKVSLGNKGPLKVCAAEWMAVCTHPQYSSVASAAVKVQSVNSPSQCSNNRSTLPWESMI